jgi:protein-serine/threonine kinase
VPTITPSTGSIWPSQTRSLSEFTRDANTRLIESNDRSATLSAESQQIEPHTNKSPKVQDKPTMATQNDPQTIPVRSQSNDNNHVKASTDSSAASTAASSPKIAGLTQTKSNSAGQPLPAPAVVDVDGLANGKGPPPTRKPTMTSRFSGIFRRDTPDSSKEGSIRNKEKEKEKPASKTSSTTTTPPSGIVVIDAPARYNQGVNGETVLPNGTTARAGSVVLNADTSGKPPALPADVKKDEHGIPKRFWTNADGNHGHYLKAAKRHQKLKDMLRNWWDKKKAEKHEDKLAQAQVVATAQATAAAASNPERLRYKDDHPALTLMHDWATSQKNEANEIKAEPDLQGGPAQSQSLVEKYGRCQEIVGHGAFGIVRVAHKQDPKDAKKVQYFAVKEFHKRPNESAKRYHKRLTSEFCLSSSMTHPNVIKTLDLLKDDKGDYCEVMEFCAGGDLYTLILSAGNLDPIEADCYFKQLMRGVEYMHDVGVAHRDLKPENLLLTSRGCLKITDFGNGECFQTAWENEPNLTGGLCGSAPYIAPEEYVDKEFSPPAVDVWACGVIYMAMRTGRHLWRVAKKTEDEFYTRYLDDRRDESGFRPIEVLKRVSLLHSPKDKY